MKKKFNMSLFLILLFISSIICFVYLAYTTNKNVSYFKIPIKYTKSVVGNEEYGISIGLNTRSHSVTFKSDSFPNKEFSLTYYGGIRKTKHFFRELNNLKPVEIGCYIDKKELKDKTIPFIYSNTEKKELIYWFNLFSYVKSQYIVLWLITMAFITLFGYCAAKENMIVSLIIISINILIWILI